MTGADSESLGPHSCMTLLIVIGGVSVNHACNSCADAILVDAAASVADIQRC